jgi:FlaA1/EpsC-like NDP-sugar epimerase
VPLPSARQLLDAVIHRRHPLAPPRAPASNLDSTSITDLLHRRAVNLATPELQRFLAGKRVMVTGAGGSIGSEICRQIARFNPARLILVERAEGLLFEIDRELRQRWLGLDPSPVIADITDPRRLDRVFSDHTPQVVFHCAAHKHVPLMEANPGEAIRNNILGTKTIADTSLHHQVAAFVMVSTDKAVNPTSVMGASKRCAELYVQHLNQPVDPLQIPNPQSQIRNPQSEMATTRFVAVRFGNVLGSSGSVVPIFRRQIEQGGPVTVTHPEMRRYFMTIPEASQLVMQAGAIGRGGEIFVLDMGEPVKIVDLAREMIRRAGLREGTDIEIQFTGMRPGEKLFEELSLPNEQVAPTSHPKIKVWQLPQIGPAAARAMISELSSVIDAPRQAILHTLMRWVPEFTPPELAPEGIDRPQSTADHPPLRLVA